MLQDDLVLLSHLVVREAEAGLLKEERAGGCVGERTVRLVGQVVVLEVLHRRAIQHEEDFLARVLKLQLLAVEPSLKA